MNFVDILAFIKSLLQSEAEVLASFLIGVVCTVLGVFALRQWVLPRSDLDKELARKDLEIARQDAEIARREAQVINLEVKLASMEEKLRKREEVIEAITEKRKELQDTSTAQEDVGTRLREEQSKLLSSAANSSSLAKEYAGIRERCVLLEAENGLLVLGKQSLEETIEKLQQDLATVEAELAHSVKWLKVFDEENARLSESESLADG